MWDILPWTTLRMSARVASPPGQVGNLWSGSLGPRSVGTGVEPTPDHPQPASQTARGEGQRRVECAGIAYSFVTPPGTSEGRSPMREKPPRCSGMTLTATPDPAECLVRSSMKSPVAP